MPPTLVCSDFSLDSIARLRPDAPDLLKCCGGLSDVFISEYGVVRRPPPPHTHSLPLPRTNHDNLGVPRMGGQSLFLDIG